ncbi:MAG: hypothetical protein WDO13_19955 [Verrucomicrobiota bacterium]
MRAGLQPIEPDRPQGPANRPAPPAARSSVQTLSITSARSDGTLAPEAWRFVFSDPGTSGNSRVVTVAAKTSSEHPDTVEAFSGARAEGTPSVHPIAQNKLVIDSDTALIQARGAAKLRGIISAEYHLSQVRSGQEPVWTLSLYAEETEPVARFQIGAKTGSVKILAGAAA